MHVCMATLHTSMWGSRSLMLVSEFIHLSRRTSRRYLHELVISCTPLHTNLTPSRMFKCSRNWLYHAGTCRICALESWAQVYVHVHALLFTFVITEHLIAETSVLVTNSEQLFSWDECGLSLHIPKNSLPDDTQLCSIYIKATIMGNYQLPQDIHLVSTVYWIECVPKCQFSQPLTLEIQHCAKPESASRLCFIKASTMDRGEERIKILKLWWAIFHVITHMDLLN